MKDSKPTFTQEAIQLACTMAAQAGGDTAKARRAAYAAVLWLQQPDVDPTYKPEPTNAETETELRRIAVELQAKLDGQINIAKGLADQITKLQLQVASLKAGVEETEQQRDRFKATIDELRDQRAKSAQAGYDAMAAGDGVHFDHPPDVLVEAVERGAVVIDLDNTMPDPQPTVTVTIVPAPEPQPNEQAAAAPVAFTGRATDDFPQFAHLPPKMRQWAIDRLNGEGND